MAFVNIFYEIFWEFFEEAIILSYKIAKNGLWIRRGDRRG
jgi:hypothetical protein